MNEADQRRFKELLEALIQQLQASEAALNESAQPVELDQTRIGRLSRVDAIQSRAIAAGAARGNKEKQERAAAALAKLEAGTYGRCVECGGAIALERLEFDPTIERCITCASNTTRR